MEILCAILVFTAFLLGVLFGWYWRIHYLMPRRGKNGRFVKGKRG